jgi:signal transduction histidine kinase
MEQVIVNLLSNAFKYAPGRSIDIRVVSEHERVIISVKDAGPGIATDRQARIFERCERATSSRKISGLGLGLFIVREIVKGHQGEIHVESEPGLGATFVIDLPLHSHAQGHLPRGQDRATARDGGG